MSMTLPEWGVVAILAVIGTVIWWGILRFIHINDAVSESLKDILQNLNIMNGRIGKAELWSILHEKQDDERHKDIKKDYEKLDIIIRKG